MNPSHNAEAKNQSWSPREEGVHKVLSLLREAVLAQSSADNVRLSKVYEELEKADEHPEFPCYVAYSMCPNMPRDGQGQEKGPFYPQHRQMAAMLLKTSVTKRLRKLPDHAVLYIKIQALKALQDPNKEVVDAASSVVTTVAKLLSLSRWPGLLDKLVLLLKSDDISKCYSALSTLSKLFEDMPSDITQDDAFKRPVNESIPRLIQFMGWPDKSIRASAMNALKQLFFVHPIPEAFQHLMGDYIKALFNITSGDTDDPMRQAVCHSFVGIIDNRPDIAGPYFEEMIKLMVAATQDSADEVKQDACEFWMAYAQRGAQEVDLNILLTYLPKLVPILLQNMIYTDEHLFLTADDDDKPDRPEEVLRHVQGARQNAQVGEAQSWDTRKASAGALDALSHTYGDKLLEPLLPMIQKYLNGNTWQIQESGILALGAIADGCWYGMTRHLENLFPFLFKLLQHKEPYVRGITCWCLSRYIGFTLKFPDDKYFGPLMLQLLERVQEKSKKVQEAACSAFATLEEAAGPRLVPYLKDILERLMLCYDKYHAKNLLILYDALITLSEAVREQLATPELIGIVMTPLMKRYGELRDDNPAIFPLFECIQALAIATGSALRHYAPAIFKRCVGMVKAGLEADALAKQQSRGAKQYNEPEKDFMISAMDLLSGLTEGFGPSIESLVKENDLLPMLYTCCGDTNAGVRQSAFALLGDMIKMCFGHVRPHSDKFINAAIRNLIPYDISVCNNASWTIGEFAVQLRGEMKPFVKPILEQLLPIINQPGFDRSLLENTAITLGRLGVVASDVVAPYLRDFVSSWCSILARYPEDNEKESAFRGLCSVIALNPEAVLADFGGFCVALSSFQKPSQELAKCFNELLVNFKTALGPRWEEAFKQCDAVAPDLRQYIARQYLLEKS